MSWLKDDLIGVEKSCNVSNHIRFKVGISIFCLSNTVLGSNDKRLTDEAVIRVVSASSLVQRNLLVRLNTSIAAIKAIPTNAATQTPTMIISVQKIKSSY